MRNDIEQMEVDIQSDFKSWDSFIKMDSGNCVGVVIYNKSRKVYLRINSWMYRLYAFDSSFRCLDVLDFSDYSITYIKIGNFFLRWYPSNYERYIVSKRNPDYTIDFILYMMLGNFYVIDANRFSFAFIAPIIMLTRPYGGYQCIMNEKTGKLCIFIKDILNERIDKLKADLEEANSEFYAQGELLDPKQIVFRGNDTIEAVECLDI